MFLLTCALKNDRFIAIIPLFLLANYDDIEIYCRLCGHIHTYNVTEDGNLRIEIA